MVSNENQPIGRVDQPGMLTLHSGEFLGTVSNWHQTNGVTLSVTRYEPHDQQANQLHYHENPNLYFILTGGSIEKRKAGQVSYQAGSLLFYAAGEPHQNIRLGRSAQSINLDVAFSFLQRYGMTEALLKQSVRTSPEAKLRLLSMYRELITADSLTPITLDFLLLELLRPFTTLKTYACWPNWVKTVHELIQDRWDETLSLYELAQVAGVNPITISKHFRLYFGCSYGDYVRKLKTEKALVLVRSTRQPLTEIAHLCGFADQSHFIRLFKKYTGFLPAQVRKL